MREFVLNQKEIAAIFNAKIKDLKIPFFDNQFQRFNDYCSKYIFLNPIVDIV